MPERALAAALNTRRPELRKTPVLLKDEGWIVRHVERATGLAPPPKMVQSGATMEARTERSMTAGD